MKLSDAEVVAELKAAGFTLSKRLDILPVSITCSSKSAEPGIGFQVL
jgi:hypothetical protein